MFKLFFHDVYYLLDPGSTLSDVTSFVAVHFDFGFEVISELFLVFTPIGDSMVAKRVYRVCVVSVGSKDTLVYLFDLDMVDFDVILGMD